MSMADGGPGTTASSDDDLPDIVDVVMDMGRAQEDLPADAPSPRLPAAAAPRLPAHLDALAAVPVPMLQRRVRPTGGGPMHPTSGISPAGRRQGVDMFPPDVQTVATSRLKLPARRPATRSRARCRRSNAGFPRSHGTTRNVASRWTARIAISRR